MTEVIGVRFKQVGKIYYFSPNGVQMPVGEKVIVETARGIECGEVAISLWSTQLSHDLQPGINVFRPCHPWAGGS